MAITFFQTYKEIQDKLSSIIRGEFRGYSVYFDDDYTNRKPSYFNIKRTRDEVIENLVPSGQFRDYGFNVRYYLRKPGYSKDLTLHALFRVGDRINQLIFITRLTVALVLGSKSFGLVKLNVYISISTRNFVISPSSMAMVLTTHEKRYDKPKCDNIVFKC